MPHPNPIRVMLARGGRVDWGVPPIVGRIVYLGRSLREGVATSTRSVGSISTKGAPAGVGDPRDTPQLGVVGITVHPAVQLKDPTGRSVNADLRFPPQSAASSAQHGP